VIVWVLEKGVFYTLEDFTSYENGTVPNSKKVYPFQEYVSFDYEISSKIPEVLGNVEK